MTVNTTNITSGPFSGNDVADTFSYTFRVKDKTQLTVYETDDSGVVSTLTVDTDYTVAGIGNDAGGTITRVAGALPTGYTWYIRANYPKTQLTSFQSQGPFFPELHEDAMDQLTFLTQQMCDRADRSPRLSDYYDLTGPLTMDDPSGGHALRWNGDGTGVENFDLSTVSNDEIAADKPVINYSTLNAAVVDSALKLNQACSIKERTAGNGGGAVWDVVLTSTVTPNTYNIVQSTAVPSLSLVLRLQKFPSSTNIATRVLASQLGMIGDYDFVDKTGTDNSAAANFAANTLLGVAGGVLEFDAGAYRFASEFRCNYGVKLLGTGTVGSVKEKGVKLVFESANGVVFDGNNGSSSATGAEQEIENIWILKAPDSNQTGWGLSFIVTDDNNKPGFIALKNVHVIGSSVSAGEALWGRGIVVRGAQSSIGLKNLSAVNCGVSGVLTANAYLDIENGVEMHFDNFYVRDASASFPSAGAAGITIDSNQTVGIPAENAPSSLIRISNSLILGDIVVGECAKLSISNTQATNLTPTGVSGAGTNIMFSGGELLNKYVDQDGYAVNIDCFNQKSMSDLSNQFRVTGNLTLNKAHSQLFLTHENITGHVTHTLSDASSTNIYDWTIVNSNSTYNVNISKDGSDNFFPDGCNLNGNISALVIPPGAIARLYTDGVTSSSAINIQVIKGSITLTGVGIMTEREGVVLQLTLSGSYLNRGREADVFALDCNGSDRNFSLNTAAFRVGDSVSLLNTGTGGNILYGTATVLPGDTLLLRFNGTDFGV